MISVHSKKENHLSSAGVFFEQHQQASSSDLTSCTSSDQPIKCTTAPLQTVLLRPGQLGQEPIFFSTTVGISYSFVSLSSMVSLTMVFLSMLLLLVSSQTSWFLLAGVWLLLWQSVILPADIP